MARQITVRNVPPELSRRLAELAQARSQSLNATVLDLLERATGINARREQLARYTTWSAEDVSEFTAVLRTHRTIDHEQWQ
ncbi:MAG: FitA-like ribbon-helix-helix domain-containing protein [Gaiellaceae bacterium]